jgi:heat shock protein HslJ
MKIPLTLLLSTLVLAIPLAGMETKPPTLAGTAWIVTAIDGTIPLPDRAVTIEFGEDNRISGNSTCNRFMGSCTIDGDQITVSPLAGTRMFCGAELMAQEQRFLDLLQTAQTWTLSPGGRLILKGKKGEIEARRQEENPVP